ncbi:ferredoxin, 2Fe-2S 2e-39 [Candidatus Kinetoplastibacterium oncopeltii TCC290E]|uniref:2Fe-2S ferredoxin n=1 Tax=Candidatus Kinetoplastidibacterium stringomonadis TCC290E TaxID=1208920 RepID=M1M8D3_9PROT|nr:ISC system 2Fe-2S type ferredoxin [Candidatus Kinetoplastibacterium oncopeltii]AGF48260.1 ferredoxin, 2Fe-2S 2e-39 [Candidatus Kinetoplastibacterium oncopeltii TCC290E]
MSKITILPNKDICPEGITINNAPEGVSICKILLDNNINIEHACGMVGACTTCHVIIKEGFLSLEKSSDLEDDMLDKAWGLSSNSRLSCQCKVSKSDLSIEIPKYTINHAKENI